MSGGHFDYQQFRFSSIADDIMKEICDNEKGYEDWSEPGSMYFDDNESGSVKVKPDGWQRHSNETLKEFKEGFRLCKLAHVYVQRIDWLLSGDDGEENFHKRLKDDLEALDREIKRFEERNWYIGQERDDD